MMTIARPTTTAGPVPDRLAPAPTSRPPSGQDAPTAAGPGTSPGRPGPSWPADAVGPDGPEGLPPGLYGPRGWTVRCGAWEVLARHHDRGRSTALARAHGLPPQGPIGEDGAPLDDYTPFRALGPDGAQRLLDVLPAAALSDRQNLAPSLGALLRACAGADGRVLLSGYGIGPQRHDERVTVEALWVGDTDLLALEVPEEHDARCRCRELWRTVRDRYALDAEALPDEVRQVASCRTEGATGWWLWWD